MKTQITQIWRRSQSAVLISLAFRMCLVTTVRTCAQVPAVLIFLAIVLAAQENGTPVPQDWVSTHPTFGETLTVATLNFSITAPHGSRWRQRQLSDVQGDKATAFIAEGLDDGPQYLVIVSEKPSTKFKQAEVDEFVRGAAESLPAGWTVLDIQMSDSSSPTADSTRVRTKLRTSDNEDMYQFGYLVPGRRSYILVTYVGEEAEPLAFSTFAESLTFLDPIQSDPSQTDRDQTDYNSTNPLLGLLLLAGIVGAFLDRSYLKAGGVPPTASEKRYLWVLIAVALLALVGLGLLGASARGLGRATAYLAVAVFSLWELGRSRVRRANPVESSVAPESSN